ncbi:MAG: hypothetical protein LIP08_00130 [Bacteroides sp.]|nr:hypothetical protein [Bacteroides sp.]
MKKIVWLFICVWCSVSAEAQTVAKVEKHLQEFIRERENDPKQAEKSLAAAAKYAVKDDPELSVLVAYLHAGYLLQQNRSRSTLTVAYNTTVLRGARPGEGETHAGILLATALAAYRTTPGSREPFRPMYLLKALLLLEEIPEDLSVIRNGQRAGLYTLAGLDTFDRQQIHVLTEEIRSELAGYIGRQFIQSSLAAWDLRSLKDKERALLTSRLACMGMDKGEPDAYALVGDCMEKGFMEETKDMRRMDLYKLSAEKGSGWGISRYARMLSEKKASPREICSWLIRAENDPDLIYYGGGAILAGLLEAGVDGEPDLLAAERLYMQTAEYGNTGTLRDSAYTNHRRLFLQREKEELLGSLTTGWEQLTADELCFRGEVLLQLNNSVHGFRCYQLACDKGNLKAKNILALTFFERGDREKAVRMFSEAAGEGFLPAIYNVAMCLYFGAGISPDVDRADVYTTLFKQLYEVGDYDHFENKELLSRNYQKHIDWILVQVEEMRKKTQLEEMLEISAWFNWILEMRCKPEEELGGAMLDYLRKEFRKSIPYVLVGTQHENRKNYEEALYYYRRLRNMGYSDADVLIRGVEQRMNKR